MTRAFAALLAICLISPPAWGQTSSAEDEAILNTGRGNAVGTGDNSQVTIVQGYTIEQHEAALARREAQIRSDLQRAISESRRADEAERRILQLQLAEVERQRLDLDNSYDQAVKELQKLRAKLSDLGEGIAQERIVAAKQALERGDTSKADELFAEVERLEEQAVYRAAHAAYQRGKIAEDEIRWYDAAEHYRRAAGLADEMFLIGKAADFFLRTGDYDDALHFSKKALERARRLKNLFGLRDRQVSKSLDRLATSYRFLGRHSEAEPLYRQAIEIDKATVGEMHSDYASGLGSLAELLRDLSRYKEAEPLYRQAIEIDKTTIGETHPKYAIDLNNLAILLKSTGRYEEAEPLFRQAVEITRTALGETHPDYATHLNNLATLLQDLGRYEEAERLYRQAMKITKASLGETNPDYATRLNNLAAVLRKTGRYDEAEPLYRQAIEIDKATIGETHPEYATDLHDLAGLLKQTGRLQEARPMLSKAVDIYHASLGADHPHTLTSIWSQADFARADGDERAAKDYYATAIEGFSEALGNDHPHTKSLAQQFSSLLREHFPDDPALAELEATFGPDIGK